MLSLFHVETSGKTRETAMANLDKLTIKGFKSIRELVDFELTDLNVIIGANGAGKSNLISFFRMLRAFIDGNLSRYVSDNGGAGDLLFNGRKTTDKMFFEMHFGNRGFCFTLVPTPNNTCSVENEARYYENSYIRGRWWELGDSPDGKSKMAREVSEETADADNSKHVYDAIKSWQIYHFHDTGPQAGMRHYEIVEDSKILRQDAANIGPFLLKLKEKFQPEYKAIVVAIRTVIPFFDDFILEPQQSGPKSQVNISWNQRGSDYPMQPYHLSDGSIRFICLATALLQPDPHSTIIIDEPELGLHPAAIVTLAELIQVAAQKTQVIVATQSPMLIDQFEIGDIIVAGRKDGASIFTRLDEKDFTEWLKDYSVGELWTKNVIAGGPVYE